MRLILFLLLGGCAPSACEQFLEAKAACYEKAGRSDDAPADYCAERHADEDPEAVVGIYECYARAYESSACETEADLEAAGGEASECSLAR